MNAFVTWASVVLLGLDSHLLGVRGLGTFLLVTGKEFQKVTFVFNQRLSEFQMRNVSIMLLTKRRTNEGWKSTKGGQRPSGPPSVTAICRPAGRASWHVNEKRKPSTGSSTVGEVTHLLAKWFLWTNNEQNKSNMGYWLETITSRQVCDGKGKS